MRMASGRSARIASWPTSTWGESGGTGSRRAPIQVDTDLLMRNLVLRNQVVLGSVNASRPDFEAAIRDLAMFRARWPRALGALITGRFPIAAYAAQLLDAPAESAARGSAS